MAVLALLVLVVGASVGLLWAFLSPGSGGDSTLPFEGSPASGPNESPDTPAGLPVPRGGAGEGPGAEPIPPAGASEDPRRFDGQGSIRGQVVVDPGVEFPERFKVVVGPSQHLSGRERAVSRQVECPGTAEEFRVDELPLGGYDVWVEAARMNSRRTPVLLTRNAAHPYVILKVFPTGFIDGYVVRSDGSPAGAVKVTLERTSSKERRETVTRTDGLYRFDDVPDGAYRIVFGPLETPLVPERQLAFTAPSMRFPDVTLPATVSVKINARDWERRAIPGAILSGFGDRGGRIDGVCDSGGVLYADNLPPGRYRVVARSEDGRKARSTLEIEDKPDQEFWLVLR